MKNLMKYKDYYARIEYSDEDEVFFGTIEGINDRISFEGDSADALRLAFYEAVDDYVELCEQNGKTPEKPYKGSFNVRINPHLHKQAALIAASRHISLNQFVEKAIVDKVENTRL